MAAGISMNQQADSNSVSSPDTPTVNENNSGRYDVGTGNHDSVEVETANGSPKYTSQSPANSADSGAASIVTETDSEHSAKSLKQVDVKKNESSKIPWPMRQWKVGGDVIGSAGFVMRLTTRLGAAGHRRVPYLGAVMGLVGGLCGVGANAIALIAGGVRSGVDWVQSYSTYNKLAEKALAKYVKDPATINKGDRTGQVTFLHLREAVAKAVDEGVQTYIANNKTMPTDRLIRKYARTCASRLGERGFDWKAATKLTHGSHGDNRWLTKAGISSSLHRNESLVNDLKKIASYSDFKFKLLMDMISTSHEFSVREQSSQGQSPSEADV